MSTSSPSLSRRTVQRGCALLASALLAACATSTHRAPVEDRAPGRLSAPAAPAAAMVVPPAAAASSAPASASASASTPAPGTGAATEPAAPRPGSENAGKPGFYTVKPGDTLIRIGLETGQNWRDLARWNGIDNPNVLEVGQVIRVAAPPPDPNAGTARPVAPPTRIESRPLDGRPAGVAPAASGAAMAAPMPGPGAVVPSVPLPAPGAGPVAPATPPLPPASPVPAPDGDGEVVWAWPAAGVVTTPFDDARNKGVAIAGKAGDPVLAAADGRVVYAGSGLRGYGNLVIVKHNNTYLTAYAHNQVLLVKEEQVVRRGQKIAEMGSSDADRVQLHFEVRRQGKPVDPAKVLPPR